MTSITHDEYVAKVRDRLAVLQFPHPLEEVNDKVMQGVMRLQLLTWALSARKRRLMDKLVAATGTDSIDKKIGGQRYSKSRWMGVSHSCIGSPGIIQEAKVQCPPFIHPVSETNGFVGKSVELIQKDIAPHFSTFMPNDITLVPAELEERKDVRVPSLQDSLDTHHDIQRRIESMTSKHDTASFAQDGSQSTEGSCHARFSQLQEEYRHLSEESRNFESQFKSLAVHTDTIQANQDAQEAGRRMILQLKSNLDALLAFADNCTQLRRNNTSLAHPPSTLSKSVEQQIKHVEQWQRSLCE